MTTPLTADRLQLLLDAMARAGIPLTLEAPPTRFMASQSSSETAGVAATPRDTLNQIADSERGVELLPRVLDLLGRDSALLPRYRGQLRRSLVYPLLVATLAFLLLGVYLALIDEPNLALAMREMSPPPPNAIQRLSDFRDSPGFWFGLPTLIVVTLGAALTLLRRGEGRHSNSRFLLARLLPRWGLVEHRLQAALFTELVALLHEHRMDHATTLQMASSLCGSASIRAIVQAWLAKGTIAQTTSDRTTNSDGTAARYPFLTWAVINNLHQPNYTAMLRTSADIYRTTAMAQIEWYTTLVPAIATIAIAGVATLIYALALFIPFVQLILHATRADAFSL